MNGLVLANKIREYDSRGFIIFITSHSEMSFLTFKYKVEALDFILKDHPQYLQQQICECMEHVVQKYSKITRGSRKTITVIRIETVNMNTLDLVRITGILLDNAIEACQECTSRCIDFGMIKTDQSVILVVRNTYIKKELDYNKLGMPGITSKGERRGIGLYNVRSMIKKYDNVIMDTEYEDEYFTQLVEIFEENQANSLQPFSNHQYADYLLVYIKCTFAICICA